MRPTYFAWPNVNLAERQVLGIFGGLAFAPTVQRRTGYTTVDGLKIAFQTYGEGQRHLIVVPGHITNIDQHSSFENTMDDVHAVMDEVGVERAALLGAGEGGPTSLLFAASFPERTSLLMLYEPFVARTWAPDVPWGITPEMRQRGLEAIDRSWGRQPIGAHLYAPSLASDPMFLDWYLRAQRAGGTPTAA